MKPDDHPTRTAAPGPDAHPPTAAFDPALDAGLAAAFGPDPTPGGWSRPPLLRDDPSDHSAVVRPSSADMPRGATDRYQLLGEIAHGGMGVILKGRDPDLGRDLAFKVLKTDLVGRLAAEQRFVEEAQIGGQLQHPGVVPVYDLGRFADGQPYFAMKLVKGRTLAELLTERKEPDGGRGAFLQRFLQVCQTVAYAHSRGVIHRDLKPANVMVGGFGEVLVMDWGLAKVLTHGGIADEERASRASRGPAHPVNHEPTLIHTARSGSGSGSETQAGSVMGTPAFMSPEQAGGEIDRLDERTDVFGLGAILCVVLTGGPPYVAASSEATRLMAIRGQLADCFARLDACGADAELAVLCKGCLSVDRDARPRHAGEVAESVAAYLASVEQRAHRAEVDRAAAEARAAEEVNTRREMEAKAAEERKRRRVQLALAASVGLLVLGGGAFGWWQDRHQEQAQRRQAEFDTEQARAEGVRRAEQAAFDTERTFKATRAREQTTRLLTLVVELRKQYRFDEAADALKQATELAATATDLRPVVEHARADLEFVRELDTIRMKRSTWISTGDRKGHFDTAGAPPAYRAAFAARGLDVTADPTAAGQRTAASAVRTELVSALDDWAVLEPDAAVRDAVLAALRSADPDSGATPFRDPAVWSDPVRLRAWAEKADASKMSPGAVVAVAVLMRRGGLDPAPLLRHAVSLYPREFLVAFYLGMVLSGKNDPDEVGAYRAARAIRPDSVAVLNNLGNALSEKMDLDGAVVAHREAIRLAPSFASAHNNLGNALRRKKDLAGSAAAYREAIRLDPAAASTHINLGWVLMYDVRDTEGAIVAFREAVRLVPNEIMYMRDLGNGLLSLGRVDEIKPEVAAFIKYFEDRVAADPGNREFAWQLARATFDIGHMYLWVDRIAEAAEWCGRATKLFTEYYTKYPGTPDSEKQLRHVRWHAAVALNWLDRPAEAITEMDLALRDTPEAEKGSLRMMRARYVAKTGDHRLAARQIAEERDQPNPEPDNWNAATAYALCVRAAKDDENLRTSYGDKAVALLRKVLDAKQYEVPWRAWRKDPDLDPIRDRADFKELLVELEKLAPAPRPVAPPPREVKQ